jgi:hypothetical protein
MNFTIRSPSTSLSLSPLGLRIAVKSIPPDRALLAIPSVFDCLVELVKPVLRLTFPRSGMSPLPVRMIAYMAFRGRENDFFRPQFLYAHASAKALTASSPDELAKHVVE